MHRGSGRFRRALAAALMLAACAAAPAWAEKRLALVVGINDYPKLKTPDDPLNGQLAKAVADAEVMAETLRGLGFDVEIGRNVDRSAFLMALDRVKRKLAPGDTALFFFAGHGIALKGSNLLLPSDIPAIDLEGEQLIRGLSVAETDIIDAVREKGAGLVILVLDACRNNPIEEFARKQARVQGRSFRSTALTRSTGLETRPTSGIFSIYSAGLGQRALDGLVKDDAGERNSVFTRVFAKKLKQPGRHLSDVMEDVREEVARLASGEIDPETGQPHRQFPAFYNETQGGRIFLAGRPLAVAEQRPGPPIDVPASDEIAWGLLQATSDIAALRRFTGEFPGSRRKAEAEARIAALEREAAGRAAEQERRTEAAEAQRRMEERRRAEAAEARLAALERGAARPAEDERKKSVIAPPPAQTGPVRMARIKSGVSQGVHNIRSGPGVNYALVASVPAGASVRFLGNCRNPADGASQNRWCKVEWRGRSGYASMGGLVLLD